MAFRDNREFIAALEKTGDVVHIRQEVDWNLEVGAIVRRGCETRSPAPLFENIKDYPGHRIFASPLATYRRVAIALGLAADTTIPELVREYERRLEKPIKPVMVKDAPCKENILLGDKVDLSLFPAPVIHEGDGGRYIGTWHALVTKEPESDWVNWGLYRAMVHNRNTVAAMMVFSQHQGRIFSQGYQLRGLPMPFAIAIGADPLCVLASATAFRRRMSEVDYAGGLRGEPVELVRCETSDLPVPAHAEIVIEGEVLPDKLIPEGPFGEATGYRHADWRLRPAYRVKAITYRHNPILTMSCTGIPHDDSATLATFIFSHMIRAQLQRRGIPVAEVHIPAEAGGQLAIVAIRKTEPGLMERIRDALAGGLEIPKVLVVEDDVDIFNLAEVIHAFATKNHPLHGVWPVEQILKNELLVHYSPEERVQGKGSWALYDCTWPQDWPQESYVPPRMSFREAYPREVQQRVLREWHNYGFR